MVVIGDELDSHGYVADHPCTDGDAGQTHEGQGDLEELRFHYSRERFGRLHVELIREGKLGRDGKRTQDRAESRPKRRRDGSHMQLVWKNRPTSLSTWNHARTEPALSGPYLSEPDTSFPSLSRCRWRASAPSDSYPHRSLMRSNSTVVSPLASMVVCVII